MLSGKTGGGFVHVDVNSRFEPKYILVQVEVSSGLSTEQLLYLTALASSLHVNSKSLTMHIS